MWDMLLTVHLLCCVALCVLLAVCRAQTKNALALKLQFIPKECLLVLHDNKNLNEVTSICSSLQLFLLLSTN
jgi:hypothetical protein